MRTTGPRAYRPALSLSSPAAPSRGSAGTLPLLEQSRLERSRMRFRLARIPRTKQRGMSGQRRPLEQRGRLRQAGEDRPQPIPRLRQLRRRQCVSPIGPEILCRLSGVRTRFGLLWRGWWRVWLRPRSYGSRRSCRKAVRRTSSSKPILSALDGESIFLYITVRVLGESVCLDEVSEFVVLRKLVSNRVVFFAFAVPHNVSSLSPAREFCNEKGHVE